MRIGGVLDTLATLERHEGSGQFYNWYSPATGEKLTVWPVDGGTVYPFLSSVDNGWLASALIMVADSVPQLRDEAWALADIQLLLRPGGGAAPRRLLDRAAARAGVRATGQRRLRHGAGGR